MDLQARAVRSGWLPFYPQFNRNSLELVREAEAAGAASEQEIVGHVVEQLKTGRLRFAVEDPEAPQGKLDLVSDATASLGRSPRVPDAQHARDPQIRLRALRRGVRARLAGIGPYSSVVPSSRQRG